MCQVRLIYEVQGDSPSVSAYGDCVGLPASSVWVCVSSAGLYYSIIAITAQPVSPHMFDIKLSIEEIVLA